MFQVQGKSDIWKYIALCCNLSLLPLRVQVRGSYRAVSGEILTWRKFITWLLYAMTLVHSIFKCLRLIQETFLWNSQTQLYQLIFHFEVATASALFSFWMIILYVRYPGAHATLLNITLREDDGGSCNVVFMTKVCAIIIAYGNGKLYGLIFRSTGRSEKLVETSEGILSAGAVYLP